LRRKCHALKSFVLDFTLHNTPIYPYMTSFKRGLVSDPSSRGLGETLFMCVTASTASFPSEVVIPYDYYIFVCVSVGPKNIINKEGQIITRVWLVAWKWEFNTINVKYSSRAVMCTREVALQSFILVSHFLPHLYSHIRITCKRWIVLDLSSPSFRLNLVLLSLRRRPLAFLSKMEISCESSLF
jgi:hypothetical protein